MEEIWVGWREGKRVRQPNKGARENTERHTHSGIMPLCKFTLFPSGAHQGQERKQQFCYSHDVFLLKDDY